MVITTTIIRRHLLIPLIFSNLLLLFPTIQCQQQQQQQQLGVVTITQNGPNLIDQQQPANYPYYMQSPFTTTTSNNNNNNNNNDNVVVLEPEVANLLVSQGEQQQQQQTIQQRSIQSTTGRQASIVNGLDNQASAINLKKRPINSNSNNNNERKKFSNSTLTPLQLSGGANNIPITSTYKLDNNNSYEQQQQQQQVFSEPTTNNYMNKELPKINNCLYEKRYFSNLDECLARKPFQTIGLPAFKNDDLLIRNGLNDKYGCVFILNNGLFKNYLISKYSIDSDSQCLDNTKVGLSLSFQNVSLTYLWTLRCLNKADQLLDDSTLDGETIVNSNFDKRQFKRQNENYSNGICVGSSQNFGFASLQLTGIEAEIELASDIYKNWRVTNITVGMSNNNNHHHQSTSTARAAALAAAASSPNIGDNIGEDNNSAGSSSQPIILGTNIREFVFESLDGDELNWRYLNLFNNWSRNKMHTNFLEQYRRFLWHSIQRCLSESSEKLPVQLVDLFARQRFS